MSGQNELDQLCINTIRTLSMDAVQAANSGHPGTPMALAPLAYVLWSRHLQHSPADGQLRHGGGDPGRLPRRELMLQIGHVHRV